MKGKASKMKRGGGKAMKTAKESDKLMFCRPVLLPQDEWEAARATALSFDSRNAQNEEGAARGLSGLFQQLEDAGAQPTISLPQAIALAATKYWGEKGVDLDVSFMEQTDMALQLRIISHMNAWRDRGSNVLFRQSNSKTTRIRISRGPGGYYSYLGTDCLHIPVGQQTMNLEGFTMNTPESEYKRVVRHETGHTLGCPHEHMRRSIIARLNVDKTIAWMRSQYGWSATTTRQQVLTPIEEESLMKSPTAETDSIMCYGFPGSITIDGQPIVGGTDINEDDAKYMASWYPSSSPPPPPPSGDVITLESLIKAGYKLVKQ